ncbi:hypothetical protein FHL15_009561 [Xylaria flabelliformis]|uniref:Mmc1 C-terminal domain-containing protein n=1 Tax=Xylaria flabelliformis TaxID=2512241 RepID=A0A553HNM0_9PEZI|nr:hypothetical protein FHL15_009561 [Xylaria flabelliformis]
MYDATLLHDKILSAAAAARLAVGPPLTAILGASELQLFLLLAQLPPNDPSGCETRQVNMPPRLPAQLRPYGRRGAVLEGYAHLERQSACFFCSLSRGFGRPKLARHPKKSALLAHARRFETTVATTPVNVNARVEKIDDPRKELESILLSLQKHAANHVNLSRLQLALNGLRQKPGDESIRIAILGLADGPARTNTAREVLRLLLSDPLKDSEAWEQQVEQHDLAEPMIIRIGAENRRSEPAISLAKDNLIREIHISSATLDGHNLEILLADTNPFPPASSKGALDGWEDAVLVPVVDIPTSDTGRCTPIAAPVHKALVVADGIRGAASVLSSMPASENVSGVLKYAVNIPEYRPTEASSLPFTPIDINTARMGLGLVRKDIGRAIEYEHLWFQSNIPQLVDWLKADILTTPGNITKPPVRELIASLLRNTSAALRAEEARLSSSSNARTHPRTLDDGLAEWAESAHSELQEQLDVAFSGGRWRKLGWWKLFWRVDDVGMLTSDILAQRFLPEAERGSVFLAGRMMEAGFRLSKPLPRSPYSNPVPVPNSQSSHSVANSDLAKPPRREISWPTHIPDTRSYLQTDTVPALQALAQKLVLQTLSTSGLMTALGALVYVGTLTTTLYEASAVAALGIVWSMRRMQKQWETARDFWEGEVREEGRKAVQGVEEAMASALTESSNSSQGIGNNATTTQDDLTRAKDLVERAEKVLKGLK